ncbi:MAG TPA: FecR family protein [Pyrinomonadaceae bacterium]|nr:FecR family protein [Pyrinomonadaceae bacterium]
MRPQTSSIITPHFGRERALVSIIVRVFVICLAVLSINANAWGQAVEARVASISGRVIVSGNARAQTILRRGELLTPGDVVDTHGGGRLRIELSDGSVVIVQPETRLILQDYRAAGSLRELLNVIVGRVRIKINHFGSQPNPYRVNSPTASIAVRGTEFGVAVGSGGETLVVVYEGLVDVSSLTDPQRRVLVEPGRGVIVRPNEPVRFFIPGPESEIGEREGRKGREREGVQTGSAGTGRENESLRSAAGVYERYIDSIVDNGEIVLPSRFAAFPDSHLDSLENPAYATEFTGAEGRLFLLPSLGGTRAGKEGNDAFNDPLPVDYSFSPQASFFKPLTKYHSVLGGSLVFSRNGIQSFSLDENVSLPSPPFPPATTGSRATAGSTTNSFLTASLAAARRFGSDGRTSLGLGLDFLSQSGSLLNQTTQSGVGGLMLRELVESNSKVQRTRLTVGLTREIGSASKLGIFYRYGYTSANDRNRLRTLGGVPMPLELTGATGHSSEIGLRLRGPLSRRLFYGAEGSLFFGRNDEGVRREGVVDSNERSRANRATLGFGVGYALHPRTVFSFDIAGGISHARGLRREDLTGNALEDEHQTARFLSLHGAVQAEVWRRLFVSGSILSVTQSRVTDLQLFPDRFGRRLTTDGIFVPDGRSRDRFTDYFSNFGAGWRFTPNFLVEYVFSTDFGQTSPRHSLLLRYTFKPGGK